jgi:hypothetical protein
MSLNSDDLVIEKAVVGLSTGGGAAIVRGGATGVSSVSRAVRAVRAYSRFTFFRFVVQIQIQIIIVAWPKHTLAA